MAIYKNANLDISVAAEQNPNYNAKPSVQFSTQDKNTAKYTFTVKQNNKPVDLTGVTASVTLYSEDKSVFQSDATITSATEGKIEYVIPSEAIRHHGKTRGDLRLTYPNGDVLGGLRFTFNIEQALIDRAAGVVGGVYIRDFETLKAEIQATADSIKGIDIVRIDNKLIELEQKVEEGGVGVDEQARQEIQEVSTQLVETENVLGGDKESFWTPPSQPSTSDMVRTSNNLKLYMDLWEGLRTKFPNYITRESLGKDQTNTHDIYKYIYSPARYEKTIIITACIHGAETIAQLILYRFLYHVCHDSNKYSQLNYIRNKVRIVVIPIANPAGLVAGTRYNGNNVDINRNFTYGWNKYVNTDTTFKGSAPLSEKETKYVKETIERYTREGATAYIDLHNTPVLEPEENTLHLYAPVSRFSQTSRYFLNEIAEAMLPNNYQLVSYFENSIHPTATNEASNNYNLHSATAEWQPGAKYGDVPLSGNDIQSGLTFIGNVILRLAGMNKALSVNGREPWAIEMANNVSSFATTAPATWEEVPETSYTFEAKTSGLLYVTSEISFVNSNATSINYMAPVVIQEGVDAIMPSTINTQQSMNEVISESGGKRDTLSATRIVPILETGYFYGPVTVKLMWRCETGQMQHRRSRLKLMFVPSDSGNRYEKYFPNSSNTMAKVYPPNIN